MHYTKLPLLKANVFVPNSVIIIITSPFKVNIWTNRNTKSWKKKKKTAL